jgi:hypothetical protein
MDPRKISPEVAAALKAGNKIEAIRILRQQMGVGLAEAKGRVEAHQATHDPSPEFDDTADHRPAARPTATAPRPRPTAYVKRDGLSPGEVPRTGGPLQATIVIVMIAVAIALYISFG